MKSNRAVAFAAALLAITLNFLQPLAHAAAMRAAPAGGNFWRTLCLATDGEQDERAPTPAARDRHQCCLGLPHSWAVTDPDTVFTPIRRLVSGASGVPRQSAPPPADIRDGPLQPRAPPSFV